jgi:hypothetical protein
MASPTSLQMATLAVQKDCEGCVHEAAEAYEKAADSLQNDVRALGTGPEADAMRTKSAEYAARAQVLRGQLTVVPAATGNVVLPAELGNQNAQNAGGWQTFAGAAGAGAVGGAMVVGSVLGAPFLGAIAGAGGLVYAATRPDGYGDAARGVGGAASTGITKAREVNTEYDFTGKASAAVKSTAQAVQAVEAKYNITDRVSQFAGKASQKAKDLDAKYSLTGKAATGAGVAASAVQQGLDGVTHAGVAVRENMDDRGDRGDGGPQAI